MKSIIDETLPFASEGNKQTGLAKNQLEPYQAWKTSPTNQTRAALLQSVAPVIDTAVYTYAGAKPAPSLRSRARLMAMQAFDTYDPTKGSLKNHVMGQLRGLQRIAGQQNQIISVPERVVLDRRNLQAAEENLRDSYGRDPSDLEVADYTGLSLKRIGYIRNASSGVASSTLTDGEGEVFHPASKIPGATSVEDSLIDIVYYDLDDIDRVIMDYSLARNGAPYLQTGDIARRLGVTAAAVSQRKNKIQRMLDEARMLDLLGDD